MKKTKKTKKTSTFISKIHSTNSGHMFWYQVNGGKRVIRKGSKAELIKERNDLIDKHQNDNLKIGS
jgi:hypothetical protein